MLLLIATGCSNKDVVKNNYIYKGENTFWTAVYKVNSIVIFTKKDGKLQSDVTCNTILTITYKKDLSELSKVKNLGLSYASSVRGEKSTTYFDKNNPLDKKTFTFSSNGKGPIEKKDEPIKVTINIDGKIESIVLKNVE
jgi:hypothetical protein